MEHCCASMAVEMAPRRNKMPGSFDPGIDPREVKRAYFSSGRFAVSRAAMSAVSVRHRAMQT